VEGAPCGLQAFSGEDADGWTRGREHVTEGWHVAEALCGRSEQRMAMTCSKRKGSFACSAALKVFVRGRSRSADHCCVHALHACGLMSSRPSIVRWIAVVCMPPLDPTSLKRALPRQQRRSLYRPRSPGQCFICVCCCFSSYRLTKKVWL
jgi:hypothetical protein